MDVAAESEATGLLVRLCDAAAAPPRPSAMLVLAHPDDECVGAATLLPGLRLATFVYVTDGAPRALGDARAAGCDTREAYAARRRGELISALDSVGIDAARVEYVGCVDQEASSQLGPLTLWLEILLRQHAPAIVLTHPYEGGHPDHDATAFAVHLACRRLAATDDAPPHIAEFTSYHRQEGGWRFGEFLPSPDRHVITRTLSAEQRALKRRLLGCHASQRGGLQDVPLAVERFRVAPDYDFTAPPHSGALLYEQFPWGITGADWRHRARMARAALAPEARPATAPLPAALL